MYARVVFFFATHPEGTYQFLLNALRSRQILFWWISWNTVALAAQLGRGQQAVLIFDAPDKLLVCLSASVTDSAANCRPVLFSPHCKKKVGQKLICVCLGWLFRVACCVLIRRRWFCTRRETAARRWRVLLHEIIHFPVYNLNNVGVRAREKFLWTNRFTGARVSELRISRPRRRICFIGWKICSLRLAHAAGKLSHTLPSNCCLQRRWDHSPCWLMLLHRSLIDFHMGKFYGVLAHL